MEKNSRLVKFRRASKRDVAEAQREHRRRSRAAKKSWETRRKRARKARKQHKRFNAKSRSHRPRLQLHFKLRGPKGATSEARRRAIRVAIRTGKLPDGWSADGKWVGWRNPDTKRGRSKNWQYGTLAQVMPSLGKVLRPLFGIGGKRRATFR